MGGRRFLSLCRWPPFSRLGSAVSGQGLGKNTMANQLNTSTIDLYNNHTKNSWSGRQVSFIRGSSRSSLPSECEKRSDVCLSRPYNERALQYPLRIAQHKVLQLMRRRTSSCR